MFSKTLNGLRLVLVSGLFLFGPSMADAAPIAVVGDIGVDGRITLDLQRFTDTISTGPNSSVLVGDIRLSVSNGFVKVVRISSHGCVSEEMRLFCEYGLPDPFPGPVRPHIPGPGDYANGTLFADTSCTGPIFFRSEPENQLVSDCRDTGCSQNPSAFCRRFEPGALSEPCGCDSEQLFWQPTTQGCEPFTLFREWWSLDLTVLPPYIQ